MCSNTIKKCFNGKCSFSRRRSCLKLEFNKSFITNLNTHNKFSFSINKLSESKYE